MQGLTPARVIHLTPNVWTEPFWAAAAEHRLVIPRCTTCGAHRLPPSPFCWRCQSQDLAWDDHDGNGTLYSFTVVRHAVIPDVQHALPLIAGVVALDGIDGRRLVGNVVDCEPAEVRIGRRVTTDWYDVRDGDTVPVFR